MKTTTPKRSQPHVSSLPSREGTGRVLAPAFVARQFKKGQSGNPSGHKGTDYGDVVRLARQHGVRALQRLVELMESMDERVALLASQALLDRGYGKPREFIDLSPADASAAEERRRKIMAILIADLDAKAAAIAVGGTDHNRAHSGNGAVPVLASQKRPTPKFS
jgi:hypothetical protein